jgi:hypothetical protein
MAKKTTAPHGRHPAGASDDGYPKDTAAADREDTAADREAVIPSTGEYSRLMKADEYREWVRQTVTGQIWGRMLAIFSALGFAGIIGIFAIGKDYLSAQIDTKIVAETKTIKADLDKDTKALKADLERGLEKTEKAWPDAITKSVSKELENQVRTNTLNTQIAKNVTEEITKSGGIENAIRTLIISRSEEILGDTATAQSSLRAVALQQILLFGQNDQKAESIARVIRHESSGEPEFALALQNYPFFRSEKRRDRARELHSILERFTRSDATFGNESWSVLEKLFVQEQDASEGVNWLQDISPPLEARYSASALKKIVDLLVKTGGLPVAEQFAAWLESSDQNLKALSLYGLTEMTPGNRALARSPVGGMHW